VQTATRRLQVFRCTECLHRFTGAAGKNKTYPLRFILETVSTFNLGYSTTETQQILRKRFHRHIPERTINSWLTEHRSLTTYARPRAEGKKIFTPQTIVRSINLLSPAGLPSPNPPCKASDSSRSAGSPRFRTPEEVSRGTGTQRSSSPFPDNRALQAVAAHTFLDGERSHRRGRQDFDEFEWRAFFAREC